MRKPFEGCEEPCEHGHFGCARVEGGPCEAERTCGLCSYCEEREGEFETASGDYLCEECYVTI